MSRSGSVSYGEIAMNGTTRGSNGSSGRDIRLDKRPATDEDRKIAKARGELPLDSEDCALCGRKDGNETHLSLWTPVKGGPGVTVAETVVSLCPVCKKHGNTGRLRLLTYRRDEAAGGV